MNIILEGPDRNGKTTLSNFILENMKEFDFHRIHYTFAKENNEPGDVLLELGKPSFGQIMEHVKSLTDSMSDTNYLFDRFVHSNLAYGPVLGNFGDATDRKRLLNEMHYANMMMANYNTVIVWCQVGSFEKNATLLEEEGENYISKSDLKEIRKNYCIVMGEVKAIPVIPYDFERDHPMEIRNRLLKINSLFESHFVDRDPITGKRVFRVDKLGLPVRGRYFMDQSDSSAGLEFFECFEHMQLYFNPPVYGKLSDPSSGITYYDYERCAKKLPTFCNPEEYCMKFL